MNKDSKKRQTLGWIAVGISSAVSSFWAFWGIIENFHEGWYYESLWLNLGLMFAQYLSPMLIFVAITLVSIFLPRIGSGLHVILALFMIWFFNAASNAATLLIILPLLGIGILYWFSRIQSPKLAAAIAAGLPVFVLLAAGIHPAIRVSQRLNDGNLSARVVKGNGVTLIWAPQGPGWPGMGTSWFGAEETCQYLNRAGLALASASQQIWRLPTADELVRSMSIHGQNSGGIWDPVVAEATYQTKPDKESPLWIVHFPVIYWWSATELDEDRAYMIAYDGKVWIRSKDMAIGNLGYRCVKTH